MIRHFALLATLGLGSLALAAAPDALRSMPPAVVTASKVATAERFLGAAEAPYLIEAEAFVMPNASAPKVAASGDDRAKPVQIGFPRTIAESLRALPLGALDWERLGDGSKVARVVVSAPGAAGLRVAYRSTGPVDGMTLRFAGSDRDEVYRAVPVSGASAEWSPVLEGSRAVIEVQLRAGQEPSEFGLTLDGLSHLVVAGADLGRKDIRDIGDSGSCNIDIACVSNPSAALLNAASATAKMVFNSGGGTYLCTGTLINSQSGGNYFYTAAHCVSTVAEASSVNTYWFFDAVSCNSTAIPPYQLLTGGADLMLSDPTMDVSLIRLRQTPPTGAVRSAWNASIIPTSATVIGIHHPAGDLKKFSQGSMLGYAQGPLAYGGNPRPQAGKDSFMTVRWTDGTTEGGSSGSGLFTYNSSGGYYELRGGLEGGGASCNNRNGIDRYSRMDLLFTRLAPYLMPSAMIPTTNAVQASMVEFYNPQYDFYFISSRENEKTLLDGVRDIEDNPAWYRTGYWFKTDSIASSQTAPITRYFIPGAALNGTRGSHFYTVLNADRAAIAATGKERSGAACNGLPNTWFCNEGTDSFVAAPVNGGSGLTCFANEVPIYRTFRGPPRYVDNGNHRYLTTFGMYGYMVNDPGTGWAAEGVAFCAKP